jgi:hypothetical protein
MTNTSPSPQPRDGSIEELFTATRSVSEKQINALTDEQVRFLQNASSQEFDTYLRSLIRPL